MQPYYYLIFLKKKHRLEYATWGRLEYATLYLSYDREIGS